MNDNIPCEARAFLIRVMHDLGRYNGEPAELVRAIILQLGSRNMPTEIVTMLRPYIAPFLAAVIAGRIDPFAEPS